jgi:polysaccharide export outer membrane protein
MGFSVMGEVINPGRYQFTKEKVSLLEALSMAGDLTIYGRRDSVLVMREVDGMHEVHSVNLSKGRSLLESPVYYLQQNDVVYVEPNDYKKRQSTASGNETMTGSFWLSFVSVLTTVAVLLIK